MNLNLPKQVKMVEVGPRDGIQNEAQQIPTDIKIKFIDLLSQTGLSTIEVTSFVSPKKIPALSDNGLVFAGIRKIPGQHYPVLVPNILGLNNAIKAGVSEIAVFTAVSETFSQKNINCTIDESLQRISEVITEAHKQGIWVRGYISCVFGCPYEGEIPAKKSALMAEKLLALGCEEIALGDTIGISTPYKTQNTIKTVLEKIPVDKLALHFHDTYGQALANILASLELGVHIFDSSVSGLGGCPYAEGASGNVASEDVLYMLDGMNIHTGVNLDKLINVGKFISDYLHRPMGSKVAVAMQGHL